MKIQRYNVPNVNPYKAQQQRIAEAKSATTHQSDKLEISSKAKQLSEISTFAAERQERVQQLKAQVQNGTYSVDVTKLANDLAAYYKKI